MRSQTECLIENAEPKWNHENLIKVDSIWFQNSPDQAPLKLSLKVYDYSFEQDGLVGQTEVSINKIVTSPGKWLNDIFPLQNKSNLNSNQQIYL